MSDNKLGASSSILLILAVIVLLPGLGVAIAFFIVGTLLWLRAKEGIVTEVGFRSPRSWTRTILLGLVLGASIELSFQVIINPLLEAITRSPLDLGPFDSARGDVASLFIYLPIGWVVGGFLEEMTFRGYLISQIRKLFGGDSTGAVLALIITSTSFGLSHLYQGASGVLSTGFIGFILGVIYIKNRYNLWLPIFTHGFVNTVGFTLIYLNLDLRLQDLFW